MKKVKAKKAKKPLPAREAAAQVGKKPQMQSEPKPTFAKQHQDAPDHQQVHVGELPGYHRIVNGRMTHDTCS